MFRTAGVRSLFMWVQETELRFRAGIVGSGAACLPVLTPLDSPFSPPTASVSFSLSPQLNVRHLVFLQVYIASPRRHWGKQTENFIDTTYFNMLTDRENKE